jgi:hypothetical protein
MLILSRNEAVFYHHVTMETDVDDMLEKIRKTETGAGVVRVVHLSIKGSQGDLVYLTGRVYAGVRCDTTIDELRVDGPEKAAVVTLCKEILALRDDLDNPHVHGVFNGRVASEHTREPIDMLTATEADVDAAFTGLRRSARIRGHK